jgi:dGTPase
MSRWTPPPPSTGAGGPPSPRDNTPVTSIHYLRDRQQLERLERGMLASWAVCSDSVGDGGREHPEPAPRERTHFQRDWHRITHSRAFRKLEYKTQVFAFGEGGEMGDVIRNRLTHTLEVSQIATSMCRALGLNEDLASAIALAHDLGHTPFGHSGEDKLKELVDSFSHNEMSLKIVRELEQRYPGFPGLNLTLHTLSGIEKHDGRRTAERAAFQPGMAPSLEAQVASIADGIAYRSHDVEDSLVSGILSFADFHEAELALWGRVWDDVGNGAGVAALPSQVALAQLTRRLISVMIEDALNETARRLAAAGIESLDGVLAATTGLVDFSAEFAPMNSALGGFLHERFYMDYRVRRGNIKGQMVIERLFEHFTRHPGLLPPDVHVVADYIAGMTDREAYSLYGRLFEVG